MKSYIDVSFTLEEDLSDWTEKEKDVVVNNIDKVKEMFIAEFNNKFQEYTKDHIKDLNVVVTFEDRR